MIDYNSLWNTLEHFVTLGHRFEFKAERSGVTCGPLDLKLNTDEFDIVDVFHFPGTEAGQLEQVLFIISTSIGIKGTLILASKDVYAENMSFEMAVKLRMHPYG